MKPTLTWKIYALLLSFFAIAVVQKVHAQVQLGQSGYTQDFTGYSGQPGAEPTGWTSSCPNYRGQGDGNSNTGGIWSYGLSGNPDRALGYLGSGTSASFSATVTVANNTGSVITGLTISYDFEQWRTAGGNTNGFNVSSSGIPSASGLSQTSFNSTPGIPYVVNKTVTLSSLSLAPGAIFSITWTSSDGAGNDNAKAIDNFSIVPVIAQPACNASTTPILSFLGSAAACQGSTVNLTTLNITDQNNTNGTLTYFSNPQLTLPVANPAAVGTGGTYYIVKTTGNNCKDTLAVPVTIHPIPNATISSPGSTCITQNGFPLFAQTAGGTWSGNGITNPSAGTFSPQVAGFGVHQVIYWVTQNNCTGSDTIFITVDTLPDASIFNPGIVCQQQGIINLTAQTPGGTWSGNGITNAQNGTFDPLVSGTGSQQIIYQLTQGNCTAYDTVQVQVNANPDATISAPVALCENQGLHVLTAQTNGGQWSGNGITNSLSGDFDPFISGPGQHQVIYSVTQNSCSDADTISIQVIAAPDATILTADTNICSTSNAFQVMALVPGGNWSGNGITNSIGTFDPVASGSGSWVITHLLQVNGCSDTDYVNIQVFSTPDATILTADTILCQGNTQLNIAELNQGGTWTGNGIINSSSGIFDPVVSGTGIWNLVYVLGQNGCNDTDFVNIQVFATPDATILTPDTALCNSNSPVNLSELNQGGNWLGNGIINASGGIFDPAVSGTGTWALSYVISQNGCNDTDYVNVQVFATPDATILTPDTALCHGSVPVNLSELNQGGNWLGSGIINPSNGIFDPSSVAPGNYLSVYEIQAGICYDVDTVDITVNAVPVPQINSPGTICTDSLPLTLTASLPGGTWSGNGITNSSLGIFSLMTTGNYQVIYQVQQNGCTGADTTIIILNSTPVITFGNPGPMCTGFQQVNLSANPQGGQWSGNFVTNGGVFQTNQSGQGIFDVYYSVTQNGCGAHDTFTVNVYQTPQVQILTGDTTCLNAPPFMLQANPPGGTWVGTGVNLQGQFTPSSAGLGWHALSYSVSNNNCPANAPLNLYVENVPQASFMSTINGLTVTLTAGVSANSTYSWNFGDNQTGTGPVLDHTYQTPGTYIVTMVVTNLCGTDSSQRQIVLQSTGWENETEISVTLFPNPVQDYMTVQADAQEDLMVTVWDATGKKMHEQLFTGQTMVTMQDWAAGMYVVSVRNDHEEVMREKVIKQ